MSDSTLLESTEIPAPKRSWIWFALTIGLVLIFLVSLFLGRYPQAGLVRLEQLQENELARLLVFNVRLPRLLTALLLGMVMASAGTVFQMIFANPLVEPGFLGVSQGAAFGAALGIVFLGATSM
ncbi:MAG TPA: iron chelate uptake ABC transporter family permease subunit, partial [Anaerolineaceae bacterium]|nr:iron chelate uptake ABC transporter family permease subunit [Anaerolineaceae bacterium]